MSRYELRVEDALITMLLTVLLEPGCVVYRRSLVLVDAVTLPTFPDVDRAGELEGLPRPKRRLG